MHGKCPKCEKPITYVNLQGIDAKINQSAFKAITYNCPYCQTVLSVEIDPLALKSDTVKGVLKGLGRQ